MTKVTSPIMRYHGAKWRLAPWVMQFFPEHTRYVEPFGGSAGVLLQKPRVESEVYNDLDDNIHNVFRVLQNPEQRDRLVKLLTVTPYARAEFEIAFKETTDPVERARRTLIRASMGFGSAGATKGATGFRSDSRRSYGTAAHLWAEYPPKVAMFGNRLAGVILENRPALRVIGDHDDSDTLFYVDPPYVLSSRSCARPTGGKHYAHELTDDDHVHLLNTLKIVDGFVVVSGYQSEIYNDMLSGWALHQTTARISAGRGTTTRQECLWLSPRCSEGQTQARLFA